MTSRLPPIAVALAVALSTAAVPSSASAAQGQRCVAPPGMAGIEQYCETVPGAGGDQSRDSRSVGKPRPLPAASVNGLRGSGQAGEAVLHLAQTRPPATGAVGAGARKRRVARHRSRHGRGSGARRAPEPAPTGTAPTAGGGATAVGVPTDNPLKAVGSAAGDGLGAGLIAVLALLAIGLPGVVLRRRE